MLAKADLMVAGHLVETNAFRWVILALALLKRSCGNGKEVLVSWMVYQ